MVAMGEVLPYRPPRAREETTAYLGMIIFLGSWAMMFAALFFAYAFARARAEVWPPVDLPRLPLAVPGVNTLVLGASSAAIQMGAVAIRRGDARKLGWALLAALGLGSVFLSLQLMVWIRLYAEGLRPSSGGSYGSVFYGLTWFHALHVIVGLAAIAVLARRAFAGSFSAAKYLPIRLWALYWHFVGIVWALMFVSIFTI